jgi:hypothetical protein
VVARRSYILHVTWGLWHNPCDADAVGRWFWHGVNVTCINKVWQVRTPPGLSFCAWKALGSFFAQVSAVGEPGMWSMLSYRRYHRQISEWEPNEHWTLPLLESYLSRWFTFYLSLSIFMSVRGFNFKLVFCYMVHRVLIQGRSASHFLSGNSAERLHQYSNTWTITSTPCWDHGEPILKSKAFHGHSTAWGCIFLILLKHNIDTLL